MLSVVQSLTRLGRRLCRDVSGAVVIYITATLPAIVGFALLAIDASRYMTLHTSLQKGVDALAIAAAGELDRLPGAMLRSNTAVANLVRNTPIFGVGAPVIDENNVTVRFFSALPDDDSIPMPTSGNTLLDPSNSNNDFVARFVEVTVDAYQINAVFPVTFLGGRNQGSTSASAVAGMDQVVCRLVPMFICNPWEDDANTDIHETASIIEGSETRAKRRRQIRIRMGPGGGGYGPGNYGFLDMGNGAAALERALAVGSPETCFAQSGVTTETGQTTGPVERGLNTRFGLYPNSMSNIGIQGNPGNDWSVRPAKNVRMGQDQGQAANKKCKEYYPEANPADGMALPRDACFVNGTCERIGDGNWGEPEMEAYWDANHPSEGSGNMPSAGDVGPPITDPPYQAEGAAAGWDELTRYEIYQYEIDQAYTNHQGVGGEYGDPAQGASCYGGESLADDTIDRRILPVAILNCKALAAGGNDLNGKQVNVPVAAFAEFFVTEPLEKGGAGTAGDIYTEMVKVVLPGNQNAVSRDMIQLYR